jgi:hypothetical protein
VPLRRVTLLRQVWVNKWTSAGVPRYVARLAGTVGDFVAAQKVLYCVASGEDSLVTLQKRTPLLPFTLEAFGRVRWQRCFVVGRGGRQLQSKP